MKVIKRDGQHEAVSFDKISIRIQKCVLRERAGASRAARAFFSLSSFPLPVHLWPSVWPTGWTLSHCWSLRRSSRVSTMGYARRN